MARAILFCMGFKFGHSSYDLAFKCYGQTTFTLRMRLAIPICKTHEAFNFQGTYIHYKTVSENALHGV
jgi:hypothetical protein